MAIKCFAPAKINLSLLVGAPNRKVGAKFGFHPLYSLVGFSRNLGDDLRFEQSSDLRLSIFGEFSGGLENDTLRSEDNLIIKAARLLQNHCGIASGADIILTKNLPIASGLGGGSADAAATLLALTQLWDVTISSLELSKIAEKLGSDVAACLQNMPLIMSGYGEKIQEAPKFPDIPILLANPLIVCPTRAIYGEYDRQNAFAMPDADYIGCNNIAELAQMLRQFPNSLEAAAFSLHPQIAALMHELSSLAGQKLVRMSGSGASCFAIFETIEDAQSATAELQQIYARMNQKIWARTSIIEGN